MTTATALRVLALATLLTVRTHTLSNRVNGYYGSTGGGGGGGGRYSKLDRFMHDRMGLDLGGNRTEPPALTTDRGHLSRTTEASVPEPEDREDDDIEDDDDDEEEDEELFPPKTIRHGHWNRWEDDENDLYDKNIQKHEPARTMPPLSENKWKLLGSRKMVEETFRSSHRISMLQGDNDNSEVYKHQMRVSKETLCKVPRAKVVKVTDVYPSSSKKYIPSCTVLHVCADDTGCCGSPTLKCGPKTSEQIYLHFIIYTAPGLGIRQSPDQPSNVKLVFYNHTECECQSRTDEIMPRDAMPTSMEMSVDQPLMHSTTNNCKCPTEYSVRYLANGACSCDCFDKQRECTRYKKGNIYFNHLDRYCIVSGQCLLPMCDYGVYSHRSGRCPKKFETLHSFKKKHYF